MYVREIMTSSVVTVEPETTLAEVTQLMLDRRIGCVPVVDRDGRLRGIITETDFAAQERGVPFSIHILPQVFSRLMPDSAIERIREAARTTTARDIMMTEVISAVEETPVEEVAAEMLRSDIDHIPIVRDGSVVGMVSRHDLLRLIIQQPVRV